MHVVLLGDSIFDNGVYVAGGPSVAEQLQQALPGHDVTLLAVDGHVTRDVLGQLERLPASATHLVVSVGGNDALGASSLLYQPFGSAAALLQQLAQRQETFRQHYRQMLAALAERKRPVLVCTVYDSIPGMERWMLSALSYFNDVIIREAAQAGVPVLDLRPICTEARDYAATSPIEPSVAGGRKIAAAVARVVQAHDFSVRGTRIYVQS